MTPSSNSCVVNRPRCVRPPPGRAARLRRAFILTLAFASAIGHAAPADSTSARSLIHYELKMAERHLEELERNPHSNDTYPAIFMADGKKYSARVRVRGSWARTWPKKPLKVFFDEGQEFEGNHCLNFSPAWRDASFMREPLAYHVYALCGVPSSKARLVRLDVNGEFRGLYVEVEQPDTPLLKRHNLKGAIYKANSDENLADERDLGDERSFARHYEKQNKKLEGYRDLQQFCHALATNRNTLAFFTNHVDLDRYINYLAAGALVQNWDCLNKNHFLVRDRKSAKWLAVPWDLDRTFGDHWRGGFTRADVPLLIGARALPGPTGWNRLADRFFSEPALRNRFLERLEELARTEFTPEKLFPIVDAFEAQLTADATRDRARWPGGAGSLRIGVRQVKNFIEQRRAFVLEEIPKLRRQ